VGKACGVLESAERLEKLPATEAAWRAGKLSEAQVEEISSAAELDAYAEQELLSAVEIEDLHRLRRRCARVRAAARSDDDRSAYLHRRRELKHWIDWEGAFRLSGRFAPEAGAVIMASLEPFRVKSTIRGKNKDKPAAYLADALVAMASHSAKVPSDALRPGPSAVVHVRVDYEALKRGHLKRGELCEVPGVGPIPLSAAYAFAADAFLEAVVMKGTDVVSVAHLGRYIPEKLKIALFERDQTCVVPGCGKDRDLEIDHVIGVERGGPTKLRNLALLCSWHHYQKTHHGYVLKRFGGGWVWHGPNGPPRDDEGKSQPELTEPD
jgi:hypothetical protein